MDPADVTITEDRDSISASGLIDASPAEVFDYLRRPANHVELSGDGTVRDITPGGGGDQLLGPGSKFGMKMKLGVPYRVRSTVVEFDQDRLIAWAHIGGHRWRWTLEPAPTGGTLVTETFDLSTAKVPPALRLVGYPARHRDNVVRSVTNLAAHFASTGA